MSGNITAQPFSSSYDPWNIPDTFTVWASAPEDIHPLMHEHWKTQKAVHPMGAYLLGFYYLLMGVSAFAGNVTVLRIFSRYPILRTPANMLIMNLAISDLSLVIGLVPECIVNYLTGGPWKFGYMACQIHAFIGALAGYSQINTLTLITWDRYNVIVKGFSGAPLTFSKVTTLLIISWIIALGLAIGPLVGWGYYTLNGMLGTCAFDAYTQDWSNKSMILGTCIFGYALQVLLIVGWYYCIVQAVFRHEDELRQQAKKMNVTSLRSNADLDAVRAEIRAAKVAVINCILWFCTWTPFAAVYMVGAWHDASGITPLVIEIPVLFAKTSTVYNPIVYALSHPKYRECLKDMYPWMCIVVDTKKAKKVDDNTSNITEATH